MPAPSTRHIEPLLSLAPPPVNLTAPVASGLAVVGQTLTTTNGTWTDSPSSFDYAWLLDGDVIPGETTNTYVVAAGDVGHTVSATVVATNANGDSVPAESNGIAISDELVAANIQWWTAAGSGLGGSPDAEIATPTSVFDSVTQAETQAGDVEYRAVYLLNTHPIRSLTAAVAWVASQTSSGTTDIAIGVAPQAAGTDVAAIPNESTPPAAVTFSAPVDQGTGVAVGTLGPGQAKGIWLRWTVLAETVDEPEDTCTIGWNGTPA